jgi:uncharacterized protein
MRIVLAGGTGLLGSALIGALRHDGHEISVLTRTPRAPGQIGWAPPQEDGDWVRAVQQADVVVNLAGLSIADSRWTAARKAAIRSTRVDATTALVSALAKAHRPHAVLVSSSAVGYYGNSGDTVVTEASPAGSDFLADVCVEWERVASEASKFMRVVLLRTGVVLAKDGGALPQLALPFKFFAGGPIGSGRQYLSWVHVDDWVSMARWTIGRAEAVGPFNVTAPQPVTNAEMAQALGRALHRRASVTTPAFAVRLALGEMADALILGGQRVIPARALQLGFEFTYPTVPDALLAIYG